MGLSIRERMRIGVLKEAEWGCGFEKRRETEYPKSANEVVDSEKNRIEVVKEVL
jgi:hypothetical protein